jgi:hypothetical protein
VLGGEVIEGEAEGTSVELFYLRCFELQTGTYDARADAREAMWHSRPVGWEGAAVLRS